MINYYTKKEDILKLVHPCRCIRCENSCNYGSGALVDGEIKKITKFLGIDQEKAKESFEAIEKFNTKRLRPKLDREEGRPYGRCVFYDKVKGCSIHPVKPFECRISMGCKDYGRDVITWFMLNYYLDTDDIESLRQFKIYLESGGRTLEGAAFEDIFDEKTLETIKNYEDKRDTRDWDDVLGLKEDQDEQQA